MATYLLLLALYVLTIHTHSQSIFRLPTTILPIHYELELHPNIPNGSFVGAESISINITSAYFDDLDGNFEMAFNYYPSNNMEISSASLQVTGPDATNYSLLTLSLDASTQIATATFDVLKTAVQGIVDANAFAVSMDFTADLLISLNISAIHKWLFPPK